eukprot:CAMPEP_0196667406 /NCGR_PEP_ID=MMETSP1086-20130531/65063_1 /TAXON_ID=77921 /ORGANISM="Cyanoptyche  gloeocystis , Strain SAG4.97" /LENGTH=224 /DNA_ID=CAMNT_0042004731 /DNA_START=499 /DNA_END=1173 /DNA_ORIENTATION=-
MRQTVPKQEVQQLESTEFATEVKKRKQHFLRTLSFQVVGGSGGGALPPIKTFSGDDNDEPQEVSEEAESVIPEDVLQQLRRFLRQLQNRARLYQWRLYLETLIAKSAYGQLSPVLQSQVVALAFRASSACMVLLCVLTMVAYCRNCEIQISWEDLYREAVTLRTEKRAMLLKTSQIKYLTALKGERPDSGYIKISAGNSVVVQAGAAPDWKPRPLSAAEPPVDY